MKKLLIFILLLPSFLLAQEYSLDQVLTFARGESWDAKLAFNKTETAENNYKLFKSFTKPSISLNGELPNYFQTSIPVTQPNGTINFQRLTQNNASISLAASQEIIATGGQLFIQSDLRRFDDFILDNKLYNGVPARIGFYQPIFALKTLKWEKKKQAVLLQESRKQYQVDKEATQLKAVQLYFDIIRAKENKLIAKLNTEANEKLLSLAIKRLELGKISQDEKLQLEIELENAKVNLRQTSFALNAAITTLWNYLGRKEPSNNNYRIEEAFPTFEIDQTLAISKTMENRPELIKYQRQLIEANQSISDAKIKNGPQVDLFASFGFARGSESLTEIYQQPFTEQQVSLSFNVPIVDWGKKKASVRLAQIQKENLQGSFEQETNDLKNSVILKIQEFETLQQSIIDQASIKKLAEKRFLIANERYVLGAISITEYTLAQRANDNIQRNYIQTLSDYWTRYYELRLLTAYDFFTQQQITYK